MKREGRQHGMVRTCMILPSQFNPRPHSRVLNRLDTSPTAGSFIKVRPRPTNHSKFTGKCGKSSCNECHMRPSCKSKDKTKGAHKFKSNDVLSNHGLLSCYADGDHDQLDFSEFSATEIWYNMVYDDDYSLV